MIIAQDGIKLEQIREFFKNKKIPEGLSVNIHGGNYCFEFVDSEETNIFCELKEGYHKVNCKASLNNIREARLSSGLTQKQAAEKCGVPLRTFQDWEYGKRKPPEYVAVQIINKLREA